MTACCLCGAPSSWHADIRGVSGGQDFCGHCLPAQYRPLIGDSVTALSAPAPEPEPVARPKRSRSRR